jgi:hypothetical protein
LGFERAWVFLEIVGILEILGFLEIFWVSGASGLRELGVLEILGCDAALGRPGVLCARDTGGAQDV